MAITWGEVDVWGGGAKAWAGIEYVKISSTDTSETWRVVGYLSIRGAIQANMAWSISGAFGTTSGTQAVNKTGYTTEANFELYRKEVTFQKTSTSQSKAVTFNISNSALSIYVTHTASLTLPAYTIYPPKPALNVNTVFQAGENVRLSFDKNHTTSHPVESFEIQNQLEGQNWTTKEKLLVSSAPTLTSWVKQYAHAKGERVRYRVRQVNKAGFSDWVESSWVGLTPLAPSGVQAVKQENLIRISWSNPNRNSDVRFEIVDQADRSVGVVGVNSFSLAPPTSQGVVQYRVRAVCEGRASEWVSTPQITLLQPPAQPTGLSPTGFQALNTQIRLEWEHQPLDGSTQTAYELQYRKSGSATWTTVTGATQTFRVLSASVGAGSVGRMEWRVRTKGAHASFSPWSSIASYEVIARPTCTVTAPTTATSDSFTITVASNQTSMVGVETVVKVLNGSSVESSWVLKAFQTLPVTFTVSPVPTGRTIRTETKVIAGVESTLVTKNTSVSYAAPPIPIFTAQWDKTSMSVNYNVQNSSSNTQIANSIVEVSIDNGPWVTVESFPNSGAGTHHIPALNAGSLRYRAVAVSSLGTRSFSPPIEVGRPSVTGIFLNWGENFSKNLHCNLNPTLTGSDRFIHESSYVFAGQTRPTLIRGVACEKIRKISWLIPPLENTQINHTELAKVKNLSTTNSVVCFRSFEDAPLFGRVREVEFGIEVSYGVKVSLVFQETADGGER